MGTPAGAGTMVQRIACTLIVGALFVVCCLVALLLGGALSPDRVPPLFAFCAACIAGVFLILGLAMLERRGAAAFERR
jgi:peptidoglycan/LPS O-acetylase OafA/YrhL